MNNSAEIHERHRRSIRLRGYDYSENGAYFVTVCTHNREHVFGEIQKGEMRLNDIGSIVKKCWNGIPDHYPFIVLDAFVVMPNHIHGILIIERVPVGADHHSPVPVSISDSVRANHHSPCSRIVPVPESVPAIENGIGRGFRAKNISPLPGPSGTSGTVGAVVRGFKIGVTKWCRTSARANVPWQRNYHEHIIRNDDEWNAFREYIEKNPEMWRDDELFSS